MAAIATKWTSGPVPFTDVDDGTVPKRPAKEEFGSLVAALPRKNQAGLELRLYQGFWLPDHWVAGTVVFQRRFVPRADDVILASYPKCGTTWLKALAFATMTRDAYPAPAQHPLLRLNPHDCIPFLDEIFADGQEAKLERLPSPRLMNTHMPHTLLPESVTGADVAGCKVRRPAAGHGQAREAAGGVHGPAVLARRGGRRRRGGGGGAVQLREDEGAGGEQEGIGGGVPRHAPGLFLQERGRRRLGEPHDAGDGDAAG
uniref:Sulfotransferase n=1 Tax=Aegilops tauschii subsp. strangulata TaxID=200361 RepID=A0A453B4J2_AEGTS